ncbi:hypothetical protein AB0N05_07540 [Nocardia sp. NPDC051030]|uniref:DoxX family protein n=1 Tax=Nocardia sp. NPDC051030 TaxID=3155162 RepID=UPI00342A20CC
MTEDVSLSRSTTTRTPAKALAALLFGAGTMHFVVPKQFDAIVPPQLPGEPRTYTTVSGAAELTIATLLLAPRTRRLGGRLALLLFLIVWPGNFQMAYNWVRSDRPIPLKAGAIARLPLQIPLITAARKVYRNS